MPLSKIDPQKREDYFCFTIIRHPLSRVLSGYQEVSMRHEADPQQYPTLDFLAMPDSPARFEAFLAQIAKDKFDNHIRYISSIKTCKSMNSLIQISDIILDTCSSR